MERDELVNDSQSMYDSDGSELSCASDYIPHSKTRKRMNVRAKRSRYQSVSNELRSTLIHLVIEKEQKIKPTAKQLGINYSTAKSILQIYRREGRVDKKLCTPAGETTSEVSTEAQEEPRVRKVIKVEQIKQDHRYPKRERKHVVEMDRSESPRPKHRSIEPKIKKTVKKEESTEVSEQSTTSVVAKDLNIMQVEAKTVQNEAKINEMGRGIIIPVPIIATKTASSNVGFVAVKSAPKVVKADQTPPFSPQSWLPLIYNPNHQINPLSIINIGLCGFFKLNN